MISLMRVGRGRGQGRGLGQAGVASVTGLPPVKILYVDEFIASLGACQAKKGALYQGNSLCCWSFKDGYQCARTTFGTPPAGAAPLPGASPPGVGPGGPGGPAGPTMSASPSMSLGFLAGLDITTLALAAALVGGGIYFMKRGRGGERRPARAMGAA